MKATTPTEFDFDSANPIKREKFPCSQEEGGNWGSKATEYSSSALLPRAKTVSANMREARRNWRSRVPRGEPRSDRSGIVSRIRQVHRGARCLGYAYCLFIKSVAARLS